MKYGAFLEKISLRYQSIELSYSFSPGKHTIWGDVGAPILQITIFIGAINNSQKVGLWHCFTPINI